MSDWLDWIPDRSAAVLDAGCNVGDTALALSDRGIARVEGVDVNPAAIEQARARISGRSGIRFQHASCDALPFEDAAFDAITCFEVLEHVPEQLRPAVFSEFYRVLKPGGRLVFSVPHNGLFAWLDPENVRFHLPAVHRWADKMAGGRGKEAGYENQKHGVVFHHHFSLAELVDLMGARFKLLKKQGRGLLLAPLGFWMRWPFYRRGKYDHLGCRLIEKVIGAEYKVKVPCAFAYGVLIVAIKV
jgi:SAM-dependent methyltransferase